ncbi:MAG: hypothetical protein AAFN40_22295 [Cyanobacteria bacterium J06560_6]
MSTTTEITLVLKEPLRSASQSDEESKFLSGILSDRLNEWQTAMSLPKAFSITLKTDPEDDLLRSYAPLGFSVWMNHHRCAYSRHLMNLVHKQVLKRPVYTQSTKLADVQLWLKEGLDQQQSYDTWKKQAIHFVAYLAAEAVINSAAALVDSAFVEAFLAECEADLPYPFVQNVLRFLLSFQISLREKGTIIQSIRRAISNKTPAQMVAESLYALLSPGKLEVHLSSRRLKQILKKKSTDSDKDINGARFLIDDLKPAYADAFKAQLQKINSRSLSPEGCCLQEVELIAVNELSWTAFQLQFNHRPIPTQYMASQVEHLGHDLLQVSDARLETVQRMHQTPATNSSENSSSENSSSENSSSEDSVESKKLKRDIAQLSIEPDYISDSIDYQRLVTEISEQISTDLNLAFRAYQSSQDDMNLDPSLLTSFRPRLFSEVLGRAIENLVLSVYPLLLTAEDVEHKLAQLHSTEQDTGTQAPQLVKSTHLCGYDSTYLASILRYLLHQKAGANLTLRNLEFILTELPQRPEEQQKEENDSDRGQCITGVGIPNEFSAVQPLDDSYQNSQKFALLAAESIRASWAQQYFELIDKNTEFSLSCFQLHPDIEEALMQAISSGTLAQTINSTRELSLKILDGITYIASNHPLSLSPPPILIKSSASTAVEAAMLLQKLISADYPEIKILYQDLLDSSVKIEIISTIQ